MNRFIREAYIMVSQSVGPDVLYWEGRRGVAEFSIII
jgi:hypothetical protein